ncbi:unnamed protein product [Victoria cruziana]
MIDSSCGGSLMLKSEEEAWVLFDTLSENSLHNTRPSTLRHQPGKRGVLELGSSPQVQTQLDSLSRKMDQILSRGTGISTPVCGLCDDVQHVTDDCPISVGINAPTGQVKLPRVSPARHITHIVPLTIRDGGTTQFWMEE